MNVSPHQQRPTRYPWPGPASVAMVVVALAVMLVVGFMLIGGPPADRNAEPSPTATLITASERL